MIKYSRATSRVSCGQKPNVSETISASIIRGITIKPCQLWTKAQHFRDQLCLHHQGNYHHSPDDVGGGGIRNVRPLSTTDMA
jgi:hypothetical protein